VAGVDAWCSAKGINSDSCGQVDMIRIVLIEGVQIARSDSVGINCLFLRK
jgi:hypothetical protein